MLLPWDALGAGNAFPSWVHFPHLNRQPRTKVSYSGSDPALPMKIFLQQSRGRGFLNVSLKLVQPESLQWNLLAAFVPPFKEPHSNKGPTPNPLLGCWETQRPLVCLPPAALCWVILTGRVGDPIWQCPSFAFQSFHTVGRRDQEETSPPTHHPLPFYFILHMVGDVKTILFPNKGIKYTILQGENGKCKEG